MAEFWRAALSWSSSKPNLESYRHQRAARKDGGGGEASSPGRDSHGLELLEEKLGGVWKKDLGDCRAEEGTSATALRYLEALGALSVLSGRKCKISVARVSWQITRTSAGPALKGLLLEVRDGRHTAAGGSEAGKRLTNGNE